VVEGVAAVPAESDRVEQHDTRSTASARYIEFSTAHDAGSAVPDGIAEGFPDGSPDGLTDGFTGSGCLGLGDVAGSRALVPALLLFFCSSFCSSLAREAYMSTYSWPESCMISYMISSVMERRM
jgi:hypothetical protein